MITIYEKPTCTTCRKSIAILREAGVDFTSVNYYIDPIPKSVLIKLLRKLKMSPRDLLRTKEETYRKLRIQEKQLSDTELIDLLVEYPDLLQRPIVEKGDVAVLARPAERIREIL